MEAVTCDLVSWVDTAPADQREFRQAVHIILAAITNEQDLQDTMVMKGGLLMAIRYRSSRYTKDLDFSSSLILAELDLERFQKMLSRSLARVVEHFEYDLDCRIQRCRINPPNESFDFHNLELSIGYAYRGSPKHRRLIKGQSTTKVEIDLNLNERILGMESIDLGTGSRLQAYTLSDLVAEKLRSLMQQEIRNRYRRQDIYDLRFLIQSGIEEADHQEILRSLREKARSRNIEPKSDSLRNTEVRRRAERDYQTLADEITGDLPDFNESYDMILTFYEGLPWES